MRLYLDDDVASALLTALLRAAGHDVQVPADVALAGHTDPEHLAHAVRDARVLLSRNYRDFEHLHMLVLTVQGHHSGILLVRRENDPSRNMSPRDIVRAIRNLEAAGVPLADECYPLNPWR
jgi:predicted nuclease of predicted toxin-antitoxin system